MSKIHLDAMLSSTSLDLPQHRKQADDAAHRAGFYVVKMESLTAKFGADAISVSMAMVEEAEVYIGIFGLRYGFRPKDTRNPNDISITEMEYRRAKELGMPILIFIMDEEHPAPDTTGLKAKDAQKITTAFYESDPLSEEKLEILKTELKNNQIVAFFKSAEDLRVHVLQALSDPDLKAAAEAYHHQRIAKSPQAEPSAPASKIPYPPNLYAFPSYSDQNALFVGRKTELQQLDTWAKAEGKHPMLLIEAIGGMGKSALAWKWMLDKAVPFAGYFWYSFYEGGADMRECIRLALAYVSRQDPDSLKGREVPKMLSELETLLRQGRYLLVLDGLERILLAYHRWDAAQMQDDSVPDERDHRACTDPQDADVLKRLLACAPSRILLTSRLLPTALEDTGTLLAGLEHLKLDGLSPKDARHFWRDRGITWSDEGRLDTFIGQFGRHSLLLKILAGEIVKDRRAQADFEAWYERHGEAINIYDNLPAKRHHILQMAYKGLKTEASKLLSQIAALGGAVDLDTLNVFNPYLPPKPVVVVEPDNWILDYLKSRYETAKTEEAQANYQTRIEEEEANYLSRLEAYKLYLKELESYPKSREYKRAVAQFDRLLQELEERGLLWWDKATQQYDLHPVVRGYAFEQLEDRSTTFDHIYNYFDAQEKSFSEDNVQSLRDLQNTLAMYNALIGAGKFEIARHLFRDRLKNVLIYGGLGLYRKAYELLLPFFPHGLTELPNLEKQEEQGYLLEYMGSVLYQINRTQEALQVQVLRLKLALQSKDSAALGISLSNYAISLSSDNQLPQSLNALQFYHALATLQNERDAIAKANYYLLASYTYLGRWSEADAAYQAFSAAPLSYGGERYQSLAERSYVESLFYRGTDLEKLLKSIAKAEDLSEKGKEPLDKRALKWLKGEVYLQMGDTSESKSLFNAAIRMGNESGLSFSLAWGGLARAHLEAGNQQEALRIVNEDLTDNYSAAYVYWQTGQTELAKDETLKYYTWAGAQGEPYVHRYQLEQARALLNEMGIAEPNLPVWDESKYEPFLYEAEVKAFIEELKHKKEAEAAQKAEQEAERQRKLDAGEILEEDVSDFDFSDDESD